MRRQPRSWSGWLGNMGLALTGPEGLLKQFTKSVLETALNEEMTEHLGHAKPRRTGAGDASATSLKAPLPGDRLMDDLDRLTQGRGYPKVLSCGNGPRT